VLLHGVGISVDTQYSGMVEVLTKCTLSIAREEYVDTIARNMDSKYPRFHSHCQQCVVELLYMLAVHPSEFFPDRTGPSSPAICYLGSSTSALAALLAT
jgi:hypothetical protein